mmetsp:Transcript_9551/g.18118  ORF Transcript_9551/g.18118 Transcript_9551/m.18118 type:complete len:502 (+) Transcript_9551:129-1634(+)
MSVFNSRPKCDSVSGMIDYLLNKFQPQRFTSNKKDAIRTFEQWLFSAVGQAASYSPQEMHRLLCGAGKKTGLLNACGGQSKKSGTLQKASIMALLLLKRMCSSDFKSHQTVQRVFVSCNMLHIESMMLRLHEEEGNTEPVAFCRKLLANKAEIMAGEETKSSSAGSHPFSSKPVETRKVTYKQAQDAEGNIYYYHVTTRETTWDRPPYFPYDSAPPQPVAPVQSSVSAPTGGHRVSGISVNAPAIFVPPSSSAHSVKAGLNLQGKAAGIFAMLSNLFSNRSSQEELVSKGVIKVGACFGRPLKELCDESKTGVPTILTELCDFMRPNIVKLHGVFRVSGDSLEISKLKEKYDYSPNEERDFMQYGSHAISGTLKRFLRELPDPLFTYERYDKFVNAHRAERHDEVNEMVAALPPHILASWNFLLDFLVRVTHFSETNMMTAKNVAIVMAPNLLRLKVETFERIAKDTPVTVGMVEWLIMQRAQTLLKDPNESAEADSSTKG